MKKNKSLTATHYQFHPPLSDAERKIAAIIFRTPNISQKDILSMVDYTQQYVSKIITNLTMQGIIKVSGKINIGRGQPIRCLKVCADYTYSVGISLMTDSVSLVFDSCSETGQPQSPSSMIVRWCPFRLLWAKRSGV